MKLQTKLPRRNPEFATGIMEGARTGTDLKRLGNWIERPKGRVHHKNRAAQAWCLICKNRADVWLASEYSHSNHPERCQPIGKQRKQEP